MRATGSFRWVVGGFFFLRGRCLQLGVDGHVGGYCLYFHVLLACVLVYHWLLENEGV